MTTRGPKTSTHQADSTDRHHSSDSVESNTTLEQTMVDRSPKDDSRYREFEGSRTYVKAPWWPNPDDLPPEQTALFRFLGEVRSNVHCRFDVRLTSLEELKHCAFQFEKLAKELRSVAFEGEADPVLRVLVGRSKMKQYQRVFLMHGKRNHPHGNTIRRGGKNGQVWQVNREKLIDESIDSKGENEA